MQVPKETREGAGVPGTIVMATGRCLMWVMGTKLYKSHQLQMPRCSSFWLSLNFVRFVLTIRSSHLETPPI